MNPMMNTEVAVNKQGIINTPNQPMYKRFSVEVTHSQKRAQRLEVPRFERTAVIIYLKKKDVSPIHKMNIVQGLIKTPGIFIYTNKQVFQQAFKNKG